MDNPAAPVSLEEMLLARERRVQRQGALLASAPGSALVCFTMNIAGPVKTSPLIARGFAAGKELILSRIAQEELPLLSVETLCLRTGHELYLLVACNASSLKRALMPIEDANDFGRLLDIDVLAPDGEKISRTTVGGAPRACLLCGREGAFCARSRAHSIAALSERTTAILESYLRERLADTVGALAVRALLLEANVTPKPGLVDRCNCGAHKDMDLSVFAASAASLAPYFRRCAFLGAGAEPEDPAALFALLREPGKHAEAAMFAATGGVNTHKGAVFLLGTLCAAIGRQARDGSAFSANSAAALCGAMSAAAIREELNAIRRRPPQTAGERLFHEHGVAGVRGELAAGLPSVREVALPWLRAGLARGLSQNDACVCALCHLIATVSDTALMARAGYDGQRAASTQMAVLLEDTPFPELEAVSALDAAYIEKNYSPGGCADLLAAVLLLLLCEEALSPQSGTA